MNYCKCSVLSMTLSIQVIFSCLLFTLPMSNSFIEVRLYSQKQFEGRYTKLKIKDTNDCVNLPPNWDKNVISIDPTGCVVMYAERDCHGLRRRLDRWSWGCSNLKDISFENKLSSLSICPNVKKPIIDISEL